VFQYHNLVQHRIPSLINNLSAFDLLLCRNVMIYFEPAIVRRLLGQLYDCLVEGGWLVVGPTEPSVDLFRAFQTVNAPGAVLYRKAPRASAPAAPPRAATSNTCAPACGRASAEAAAGLFTSTTKMAAPGRRHAAAERRHPRRSAAASTAPTLAETRAMLNCGQSDEAAESCRRLMAADPLDPFVHYYEALVAEQQGHSKEVEAALRRAVYLDRDFVLAHYHLGLVQLRKRDGEAAGRSFRNVLALLHRRAASEIFPDADGLTVGALRQLTNMQLEVLSRT
jgi:chemotaxis protein methyltransferase CheR